MDYVELYTHQVTDNVQLIFENASELNEGKTDKDIHIKPQVKVPYDLTIEKNTQESVDEGHSPWRLDPIFTTQVFVSLHLFPEGITSDYPIEEENLTLLYQDDALAIVEVNDSDTNIIKVYLKRLIRQNDTGIWTVIGYDLKLSS